MQISKPEVTGESSVGGFSGSSVCRAGTRPIRSRDITVVNAFIDFQSRRTARGRSIPFSSFWKEELFHVEHSGVNQRYWPFRWEISSRFHFRPSKRPITVSYYLLQTKRLKSLGKTANLVYSGESEELSSLPSIEDKIVRFADRAPSDIFGTGRDCHG